MNRRIILVGPTCSGKTYLRNRFAMRGFRCDISYTSREMRPGEVDGVHYHFIHKKAFERKIKDGEFYEWVEYNGNYYGTGMKEWNELPLFIMETDGINHIKEEDRKHCFVIYIDTPEYERVKRMRKERRWSWEEVEKRLETDNRKFRGFRDYDLRITNPDF